MLSEELSTRAVRDLIQNIFVSSQCFYFGIFTFITVYRFDVPRRFVIDKEGTWIAIA